MKFTLNWLQKYVDTTGLTPTEIADKLTMLGLEVDSVAPIFEELAALKTGLVISCEKHPDADKLSLCQVQVGDDTHQIVCGAPNVREGLAVTVALPGAVLPGNFKIKKSKVRGIASAGMLCSERELGIGEDHDGIMELPEGMAHGQRFIDAMELSDTFIEVDLTPNRPDCASVIGTAREIAGKIGRPLQIPVKDRQIEAESRDFSVEVESSELCPRYTAKLIKNVTVGKSPWWLRKLLVSVGMRPINNIVDITNFVMLEYGQPLHAFDFKKVAGNKIVVRLPRENETEITTLDGTKREISAEMLLICDADKPIAVAGVMGGANSEIDAESTDILLESACFNPVSVRKTARNLKLPSEASYRFERGVDPGGVVNALDRAAELIAEIAGGALCSEGIDNYDGKKAVEVQRFSISRTSSLIGVEFSGEELTAMLTSIEMVVEKDPENEDILLVTAPTFRIDIEREADLVEEIARIYGYDNVPTATPLVALSYPEQDDDRLKRYPLALKLTRIGFNEAINYSFVTAQHADMLQLSEQDYRRKVVTLLNPLSEEQAVMRACLLPSLLENVKRNISFQKTAVKLFEIGKIFLAQGEDVQPIERQCITGVLSGNKFGESSSLYFKSANVDIFDAKGTVEFILSEMGLTDLANNEKIEFTVPPEGAREPFSTQDYALTIHLGPNVLGTIGKVEEEVLKSFGIKHEVYYFDLNFDALCALSPQTKAFSSLPVYPAVKRDIALVVPASISAGELLATVRSSRDKLMEYAEIFDVFEGGKIQKGYKSVAVSITYRSQTKTLTEKNVEKSHSKIVSLLTDRFGGSFRDA
ncbi:phenylalanine--tRNA ligase subunit beta [Desulfotalea psychrophila]|uniref:Phenylalanine--tRNA ligase beta subunit n=1 Tax=Desulfotalea psychrophila (strain LSv54 / DSM 12343) TaxID=177439 RepID=SYFB_DESPS|nr:phenylalanine--tRNA ligase subunit beta [Desulfotalea psychrophila]Q6ANC2.1 RecName: Full=Phenylalanine--tRNA ligase beta subunit; AltName: Full=Phenylalanyl-tRNA synthetase beta subunit; Short=PheRS [Desulfotalea psychrophila LSv54]CAG36152.1 related to phenylalanyl-tRNA synthetase, beta chain [Desulfotalea psychrophila LSv54]